MRARTLALLLIGVSAPSGLHPHAQATQHFVTLTWESSTPGATFNVYQDSPTGPPGWTKLNSVPVTTTTYTDTTVKSNKTYCYQVTAVLNSAESTPSNQSCANVPK